MSTMFPVQGLPKCPCSGQERASKLPFLLPQHHVLHCVMTFSFQTRPDGSVTGDLPLSQPKGTSHRVLRSKSAGYFGDSPNPSKEQLAAFSPLLK